VFGGTPTTARGTHALPIHFFALIRIRGSHSPANHSSDEFSCPIRAHPGLSVVEFPGLRLAVPGLLSIRNIVKKKRRKSQISQHKAVATNQNRHPTSGKNQNREYFTVFFGADSS
jgi:hypothetical protein